MKKHYLYPGMIYAAAEETEISTLLGSCVSIALFDPQRKIGGMNHFLLPEIDSAETQTARYGNIALPQLIEELRKMGSPLTNLKAKVFGGGNVVSILSSQDSIGQRNIDFAIQALENLKIPIVEKNFGGEKGRRIVFNTATGNVQHRFNDSEEVTSSGPVLDLSGRPQLRLKKEIKVLIVDDSAAIRTLFTKSFEAAGLKVVGCAADPFEAREIMIREKPEVMTLDIEMPKMNGVQFLEKVMKHMPLPTVMVSSLSADGEAALKCLELGAIEFFQKVSQHDPRSIREMGDLLVEKVRAAATIKVGHKIATSAPPQAPETQNLEGAKKVKSQGLRLLLAGGNAGSTESFEKLLSLLPSDTPPLVIACSTISSFLSSFIQKIQKKTALRLQIAGDKNSLSLGCAYLIPAGHQGKIFKTALGYSLELAKSPPVNSQQPSSSFLFSSGADVAKGECLGILLGGFGTDGCSGLARILDHGGLTLVQTPEETSFPFGPQAAISEGVASHVLNVSEMATFLFTQRSKAVV